jgi:nicotinamide-nucleotide amidase
VYTKYMNPVTTILAGAADLHVFLRARCTTAPEAEALLAEVGPQVQALLGDRLYTTTGEPLEAVVGRLLTARGETVTVAESATGGLLAEHITSIPGSSKYFSGGFLTYSDEAKVALVGVAPDLLRQHGAVSEPVAKAMAAGARERMGATWGVSITGFAGPEGGTEQDPVGTMYIGLASPDGVTARRLSFFGDRARVRALAVVWALDMLRCSLARAAAA